MWSPREFNYTALLAAQKNKTKGFCSSVHVSLNIGFIILMHH